MRSHQLTKHRKFQIGITFGVLTASISEMFAFPAGTTIGLIASLFWIWEQ